MRMRKGWSETHWFPFQKSQLVIVPNFCKWWVLIKLSLSTIWVLVNLLMMGTGKSKWRILLVEWMRKRNKKKEREKKRHKKDGHTIRNRNLNQLLLLLSLAFPEEREKKVERETEGKEQWVERKTEDVEEDAILMRGKKCKLWFRLFFLIWFNALVWKRIVINFWFTFGLIHPSYSLSLSIFCPDSPLSLFSGEKERRGTRKRKQLNLNWITVSLSMEGSNFNNNFKWMEWNSTFTLFWSHHPFSLSLIFFFLSLSFLLFSSYSSYHQQVFHFHKNVIKKFKCLNTNKISITIHFLSSITFHSILLPHHSSLSLTISFFSSFTSIFLFLSHQVSLFSPFPHFSWLPFFTFVFSSHPLLSLNRWERSERQEEISFQTEEIFGMERERKEKNL